MKALNYIREFELQRMKELETVKEYSERLLDIVNKIRLLGTSFDDSRIVQKMLVTAPEKYEASITTLENTRDLSTITLAKLLNSFQAQEQRRSMRQNGFVEGALPFRHHEDNEFQKKQAVSSDEHITIDHNRSKGGNSKEYPPCKHYNKSGDSPFKCWRRLDAKCKKCNQLGREAIICKNKKQVADAQVADQDEEDHIFVATCFSSKCSSECWLIDIGCTNHMTYDITLFKYLNPTEITKVKVGNGVYIPTKGKGTVAITTTSRSECFVYFERTDKRLTFRLDKKIQFRTDGAASETNTINGIQRMFPSGVLALSTDG
ncbi:uncharacterized protein LOC110623213 [Manihot esculenta]|uniref:uncharacterized protein LOC110623213 n=1 Tax=Manihot esculenta TaxID=3983 RepID=UPI001CC599CD|nr:uncharacterized protein LOC110623213 [Manihot esculenta]